MEGAGGTGGGGGGGPGVDAAVRGVVAAPEFLLTLTQGSTHPTCFASAESSTVGCDVPLYQGSRGRAKVAVNREGKCCSSRRSLLRAQLWGAGLEVENFEDFVSERRRQTKAPKINPHAASAVIYAKARPNTRAPAGAT